MISTHDLDRISGMDVVGPDGDKIGTADHAYVDDQTGEPSFVLVNTGLFGMKSSFIPLAGADFDGDALRVAYDKDLVKDAPKMDADGHLSPDDENELYRHYSLEEMSGTTGDAGTARTSPTAGAGAGMGADTTGRDTSGRQGGDAMTRSEEELDVGTRRQETGKARLRKHVVTEHVTKSVPVQREEVRIEREPITDANRDEATTGRDLTEDEHEVTLHEEVPVVEKRTVPKEQVRLDKETHTDEEQVEEDLAREEIDLAGMEDSRQEQGKRRN